MDDLISRQDAIGILKKRHDEILPYDETISGALSGAIMLIKTLPSAQKKGHWMPIIEANENGEPYQSGVYCSECGFPNATEDNFCSECGADMRGEDDG